MTYDQFLEGKIPRGHNLGFEPGQMPVQAFDWQKLIIEISVRRGRNALFEDCGLGKTLQQISWSDQCRKHSNKPSLILAPLAVAPQTVREGAKFGFELTHCLEPEDLTSGINILNYERLEKFLPRIHEFAAVALDESSILKNFMGKTRRLLTDAFAQTPYRLACTATPAPNDFMEFGQHAEFLGVMPSNEMLSRFFINDTMNFGTYRLKKHAREDFWRWVSSWAACVSKPSDLGFSDDGFILPALNMELLNIATDQTKHTEDGELFRLPTVNATTMHREMRITSAERARAAADLVNASTEAWIVWCNTNYEADELRKLIPDAVEVRGSDRLDAKEEKLELFSKGEARVIITKPSIAGHGLNWQHCRNIVFVGLSYSFEDFYQALRRSYRFGQTKQVNCYIIQADTEGAVLATVQKKIQQHEEMQKEMRLAASTMLEESGRTLTFNTDIEVAQGPDWTLYHGDCVRIARQHVKDNSIHYSIYSPPFANLYIYSADVQDMGNCASEEEFFDQYRFAIREIYRMTKPGCLSSVHCKNLVCYANRDGAAGLKDFRGMIIREHEAAGWIYHAEAVIWKDPVIEMQRTKAQGLLFKQLRQDSRYSRMGMPEYVIHFRKWGEGMDEGEVAHDFSDDPTSISFTNGSTPVNWQKIASPVWMDINQTRVLNSNLARDSEDEKHICPLQLGVVERCLELYTNRGDIVFSPFAGIGSEGYCCLKMGRRFIGAELKRSYWEVAQAFLNQAHDESRTLFDLPCAIQSDKPNTVESALDSR